jgi:hypothetical protein
MSSGTAELARPCLGVNLTRTSLRVIDDQVD